MKLYSTLITVSIIFFFCSCKKEKTISASANVSNPFFDSAVQYLKSTLSQNDFDKLDIAKTKTIVSKGQNFGVEIFEKGENDNKFILLKNINANYSGNWIDISRLTKSSLRFSSGTIILKSINNNSVTTLVVDSNKVIEMDKTSNNNSSALKTYFKSRQYSTRPDNLSLLETTTPVLPEVIIYYDPYGGSSVDYYSWYWLFDQSTPDSYSYFNSSSTGGSTAGSSGAGNTNVVVAPKYSSPNEPITDINKELKCFTNNSTSTYDISVNINQPDPGTRDIVNALSAYPVGHTFITLQQQNADGTSIVRTIGFYPKNSVKPGSETDQSIFGDDSQTPYDVSLDFSVTGTEMNKVINRILGQQALQYNLDEFNCTNAAMDAMESININLPSTKSDSELFSGNDPGDLGQDIRGLNLNNFSAENGNRKITRTTSNSNNQYSKGRAGGC
jgi:hypothetical protein